MLNGIVYLLLVPLFYGIGWLLFTLVLSTIIGVTVNRVITHWYQTRLNYQVSVAKQVEQVEDKTEEAVAQS